MHRHDTARLSDGQRQYVWTEWADGATATDPQGWAHHDVVVTRAGMVVTFDASTDDVLVLDPDGRLVTRWASGVVEGHGMTLVPDGIASGELLWITDCNVKAHRDDAGAYSYDFGTTHGRVVAFTLDGTMVRELPTPPFPLYSSEQYRPTAIAVDLDDHGVGSGDHWVADGYGQSLVHRFDRDGNHVQTIDGAAGAGRFDCPHTLFIDRRRNEPELYVADRANARLQVFSLTGEFRRTVGVGLLRRPSAIATHGEHLVIGDLEARLVVFDADDHLLGVLGADGAAPQRAGWPNAIDDDGRTVRPPLHPGRFNSPHGLAVGQEGQLFVAEWLIGGRVIRLDPDRA